MTPAQELHQAGQSLWLDSISRRLLASGTLARYTEELAVTGLTSNPTILGHAMAASSDYDDSLRHHVAAGATDPQELVYAVAMEDLTAAADLFRPAWEATGGADGHVSVEVPPGLAYDARQSAEVARRLRHEAARPNLLVKIPGTPQGLTALEQLIFEGIGINVTLLFSIDRYEQVMDAYIRGLTARAKAGEPLQTITSVASFFLSRIDSKVDPQLGEGSALRGRLALASARVAYQRYQSKFDGPAWAELERRGESVANPPAPPDQPAASSPSGEASKSRNRCAASR